MLKPYTYDDIIHWRDSSTFETRAALAGVWWKDDFLGRALDTTVWWATNDTGAATEAVVADAPNGVYALALDATNEIQLAGIDFDDHRPFTLNQGLIFECRFRFTVLPTTGVTAYIGVCGDHNAAAGTVAESIWAKFSASGAMVLESDDTVNEQNDVASGVTLIANQWTILRIECEDETSVRFFADGARKAGATVFNMSQVAALQLQPVVRLGKEAATTGVGTLQIDYATCYQHRGAT